MPDARLGPATAAANDATTASKPTNTSATGSVPLAVHPAPDPIAPERFLDTRSEVRWTPQGRVSGPAGPDRTTDLEVGESCPTINCVITLPGGAAAIAANVTRAQPTADGFVTVYPGGRSTTPTASVLNFLAGQHLPNAALVARAAKGRKV